MMTKRDGSERRQAPDGDFGAFQPDARGCKKPLTVALIGVHALGAFVYTAIGAVFIGWETCDIPGADGGADIAAGLAFLPVLAVVVLVSLVCLDRAVFVYGTCRCWPISRYELAVPFFWAFAVFVLRCPRWSECGYVLAPVEFGKRGAPNARCRPVANAGFPAC